MDVASAEISKAKERRALTAPVETVTCTAIGIVLFWMVAALQRASTKAPSSTYTCMKNAHGERLLGQCVRASHDHPHECVPESTQDDFSTVQAPSLASAVNALGVPAHLAHARQLALTVCPAGSTDAQGR